MTEGCDQETVRRVTHLVAAGEDTVSLRETLVPSHFDVRAPALLLLHGFAASGAAWDAVAARLLPGRRILALDLPGHGASRFANGAEGTSMQRFARALVAALDALSIGCATVAGYSMGGRAALYFTLEHPGRVRRLVLESASAGIAGEDARRARAKEDDSLARFIETHDIDAFVDRWERVPVLRGQLGLPPAERERLRSMRLSCSRAGLAASLRGMGTGRQPFLGGRLGEIGIPTLVVAGAEDEKFSAIGRELAAGIPKASFACVAGAGHTVHLEAPGEFVARVAEFDRATAESNRETERERRFEEGVITT